MDTDQTLRELEQAKRHLEQALWALEQAKLNVRFWGIIATANLVVIIGAVVLPAALALWR